MQFVHLHNHSQYSLLESSLRIEDLIVWSKQQGYQAVALTDKGNLHGALQLYQKAKKQDLKPIVGLELDLSLDQQNSNFCPLLFWAKNNEGLRNLFYLSSYAQFTHDDNEHVYTDLQYLQNHSQGLICALAPQKPFASQMLGGQLQILETSIDRLKKYFAPGDLYLAIAKQHPEDAQELIDFAKQHELAVLASNNVHYLQEADAHAQDVLMCIGSARRVQDRDRIKFDSTEYYLKSTEQMQSLFSDCPQALENTVKIAQACDVSINLEDYCMPEYDLPQGRSPFEELARLSYEGLEKRWPQIESFYQKNDPTVAIEGMKQQYKDRLAIELKVIEGTGFAGYFLIVQDFINYAKSNDIPVGPGRGSAAGSLVAFCTRITDVDPIPYNLLFERFLNAERISMPDIDVDFCQEGRDRVIQYVAKKYDGSLDAKQKTLDTIKVAQIGTFGKLQARAVIRDVGRALGMPYGEVDKIAKLVPNVLNITLKEAFEQETQFEELRQEDPRINELLDVALSLEGLTRHVSVHAAGVVVSDEQPLVHHVPLSIGQHGEAVTQWDMKAVENVGLVKFDFLGLKTLTLLHKTCELIKASHGIEIDLLTLNMHDEKVFEILAKGSTQGIFQLESSGMRELVMRLKPNSFEDIVALVALYRPGPLGSGMVDDFINRKHGRIEIKYDLPELEPILKETYGVILYQEQVMQIASSLASYSLGEADLLRRAMGKKIAAEMAKQEQRFLTGAASNQFPADKSKKIFDLMEKFAGYGFNKSHSAAYALISYQTAYLKAHYPKEFMAACLTIDRSNTDKVVRFVNDCKKQEIKVCPPNINQSEVDFNVVDGKLLYGLAAVKNVGVTAIESVVKERQKNGPFKDLFDFASRIDTKSVNRKTLEALVKCGALDALHPHRAQNMASIEQILAIAGKNQRDQSQGQTGLFAMNETGMSVDLINPKIEAWPEKDQLEFEKQMLGFYVSGHPLASHAPALKYFASCDILGLSEQSNKSIVRVGGMVSSLKEITTKKGDRMAFVGLEDLSGSTELVVFKDVYEESRELLKSDKPIIVSGTLEHGDDLSCKIIADKFAYLETPAEVFSGKIRLKLEWKYLEKDKVAQLREILLANPGDIPCDLYLGKKNEWLLKMNLSQTIKVKLTWSMLKDMLAVFNQGLSLKLKSDKNNKTDSENKFAPQWKRKNKKGV
ncbi:MAG TPA: DNA polymerase III subunit alpha [Oligoflexia bacterium]|nr:DNA polymerase III subunit alpha [Oligoflexia bacterium]HMR25806.1 DNA polymerase III subunit alpha [Oligoflexia bacterium]